MPKNPPTAQPRVDPRDARLQRASPVSRHELADPPVERASSASTAAPPPPRLRFSPQTETDEMALLRTRDGALRLVHLQAQAPFDELAQARHHPLPRSFAADVDVAIVCIANESMATPVKLTIELVQHDVGEQRRKRASPAARPPPLSTTTPSGITTLAFSIRPMSTSSRRSPTRSASFAPSAAGGRPDRRISPNRGPPPPVAVLQMPLGLGDRRVATTTRSKPVARRVKRRLAQWFEHLPHGLTYHPVDHVGNAEPALPAPRLRDLCPADPARHIRPRQQVGFEPGQNARPLLKQLIDRLPIRTRSALVRRHLQQRTGQSLGNLLHRRRRRDPGLVDRLRRSRPDRPKPVWTAPRSVDTF